MADKFRAGTTYSKTFKGGDYAASQGWAGTLYLRGAADISVSATADGDDFDVEAAAATTAAWTAGYYQWFFEASKDGEKHILQEGTLEITAAVANITAGTDVRSHVKKTLDAINSLIEGKATADVQQYQINGRMLTKMGISELMKWRSKYQEWYAQEQREEKLARGVDTHRQVKVRF